MTAATAENAVGRAYIEAYRFTWAECERRGIDSLVEGTEDLTNEAREIAMARLHEVLPGFEAAADEDYQRRLTAWTHVRKRRRFSQRTLRAYPLTQPAWCCQRCGVEADGALELDHMMELVSGGPDHPHNLIRLCSRCHRAKPYLDHLEGSFVEWRLAIVTWAQAGPMVRW